MNRPLAALLVTFFVAFAAWADPPDLAAAIRQNNLAVIEAVAASEGKESAVAQGALAALRREDEAALEILAAAAEDDTMAADLKRAAWSVSAGVYLRQGRFAEAVDAFEAADAALPEADEEAARSAAQARDFARTAASAAPMRAHVADTGEVEITRDLAGLPRATALINGQPQDAVLDTGANYSTIMASVAEALGVQLLEGEISVGASANASVAGRIGIASNLVLAGGEMTDVVFIVLPDEALSFADGAYTIPAIIGLPVFAALGRVSFEQQGDTEWLRHAASEEGWNGGSNLVFSGLSPIALLKANGSPVRMFIDSGATTSHLTPRAVLDYPALLEGARSDSTRIGGAGGERVFEDAAIIPRLEIEIAGQTVTLNDIHVLDDAADGRHGLIGQDILNATTGYVIDFGARRFELLPPASPPTP